MVDESTPRVRGIACRAEGASQCCALALGLALGVLLAPASSRAQVPFAAGTYERWGALFDAPSAPLPVARTALLPEWIRVEVDGPIARVTIEPEARVIWEIRYGAHGAEEKVVRVDGEEVLRARYERDASGHLVRKVAEGLLAPTPLVFAYQTDARGRVVSRERASEPAGVERLEARWGRDGSVTVRVLVGGVERRIDRWDRAGRLLETRFPFDDVRSRHIGARRSDTLSYRRDGAGVLVRVLRAREATERASFATPDPTTRGALSNLPQGWIERGEAHLLFGAPTTSLDRGRGAEREISDTFSSGCWLNETDRLDFDATGLFVRPGQGCICGFCVEASRPWSAEDVVGRELHWRTRGWLRIDGDLVITGEHELATPIGPRRADALAPCDEVLGADGSMIVIRTIEPLPDALRLGHNVETTSGMFAVGRWLVVSEPSTARVLSVRARLAGLTAPRREDDSRRVSLIRVQCPFFAPVPVGHRVTLLALENLVAPLFGGESKWEPATQFLMLDEHTRIVCADAGVQLHAEAGFDQIRFEDANRRISARPPLRGQVVSCVALSDHGDTVYLRTVLGIVQDAPQQRF